MLIVKSKAIFFLLGGIICLIPINKMPSSASATGYDVSFLQANLPYPDEAKGYRDITVFEDQFVAVGTFGRIDRIARSGKITPVANAIKEDLNGVIYDNKTIIAVGNGGTILVSTDGQTCRKIESGTTKNINSITSFSGILVAASEKDIILIPEDGNKCRNIHLSIKGEIISVSAGTSACFGVTDKGEIIRTSDAVNWDIFDYNLKYAGYNKPCSFKDVLLAGNRIAIIGEHEDGTPAVLFSSLGNLWTERALNYTDDNGVMGILTNLPNDISYDSIEDQFFIACANGEILSLPSCSKCNKLYTVTGKDLYGINNSENTLIIVGADYFVNTIKIR